MTPQMLIYLVPLAAIAMAVLFFRPLWGFVLVVLLFGLEQLLQSYFSVFRDYSALFNYVVAAAASVGVAVRFARREPVLSGLNNPVTYLILAQFALFFVGMVYSPVPDLAWVVFLENWPYLALLLIVTPLLVGDLWDAHDAFIKIMVVGALVSVLIIFNPHSVYYAGRLSIDLGMTMKHGSRFGNVLALAELGGTVALIAAMIVPRKQRGLFTVIRVAAFIIGLGVAIGSGSRGQVLATVVAGILFYPLARRVNSIKTFFLTAFGLTALAAVIYITFQLFIGEQNRARWDIGYMIRDISGRFELCVRFLEALYASPSQWLFGLGTRSWIAISGSTDTQGNYVHNVAVEMLCEQGIVGGTIFLATTICAFRAGLGLWRMYRDDPALRSAAAILLALGAFGLFNALKAGDITGCIPFYIWLVMAKIATREKIVSASWQEEIGDEIEDDADADLEYADAPGYAIAR